MPKTEAQYRLNAYDAINMKKYDFLNIIEIKKPICEYPDCIAWAVFSYLTGPLGGVKLCKFHTVEHYVKTQLSPDGTSKEEE